MTKIYREKLKRSTESDMESGNVSFKKILHEMKIISEELLEMSLEKRMEMKSRVSEHSEYAIYVALTGAKLHALQDLVDSSKTDAKLSLLQDIIDGDEGG